MSHSYRDPHSLPEEVGARVALVIVLELTLLLGGTYGAWRFASSRGPGVRARATLVDNSDSDNVLGIPPPPVVEDEVIDIDPAPAISLRFNERQRFGIRFVAPDDPDVVLPVRRLTSSMDGSTSFASIRLDGQVHLFGQAPGQWGRDDDNPRRRLIGLELIPKRKWVSAWEYPGPVRITQTVVVLPNEDTRRLDTVFVHFQMHNRDAEKAHTVGLRYLLDTHAGEEDGVPFVVPGQKGRLHKPRTFTGPQVPALIQAIERDHFDEPGAVPTLSFPESQGEEAALLEAPERVVLGRIPETAEWDFEMRDFDKGDSCIAMYWKERKLEPGERRSVAFMYGQGKLFIENRPRWGNEPELAVSYGPRPSPGGEFDIIAWVKNPHVDQVVRIELPREFQLFQGAPTSRKVPFGRVTQVSWKVRVADVLPRRYSVSVHSEGETVTVKIPVQPFELEMVQP